MASSVNVDNVLFTRAKWRLRLLVPCWTFQIVMLLCLMGIFAYRVAETLEHYDESKQNGQIPMVEIVWESTNVGFSTLALVCTLIEISKTATESLTPFAMLCTHVLKLTLAFAMLALDITVYLQQTDHEYSIVGLALDCGFLAVAIGTFVYSLLVFHRLLKYEKYHLTENTKQHPSVPHDYGHDRDMEFGNTVVISAKRDSYRDDDNNEEGINLKAEVDRRIRSEFGWSTPPGVDRSSSIVVGQGTVASRKASPTENELRRSRSYVTERAVLPEDEDESESEDQRLRPSEEEHVTRGVDGIPVVVVQAHNQMDMDDDRRALLGDRK